MGTRSAGRGSGGARAGVAVPAGAFLSVQRDAFDRTHLSDTHRTGNRGRALCGHGGGSSIGGVGHRAGGLRSGRRIARVLSAPDSRRPRSVARRLRWPDRGCHGAGVRSAAAHAGPVDRRGAIGHGGGCAGFGTADRRCGMAGVWAEPARHAARRVPQIGNRRRRAGVDPAPRLPSSQGPHVRAVAGCRTVSDRFECAAIFTARAVGAGGARSWARRVVAGGLRLRVAATGRVVARAALASGGRNRGGAVRVVRDPGHSGSHERLGGGALDLGGGLAGFPGSGRGHG